MPSYGVYEITLAQSEQWAQWFAMIKIRAGARDIWDKIDPSLSERPKVMRRPIGPDLPKYKVGSRAETLAAQKWFKIDCDFMNAEHALYDREHKALVEITDMIIGTVAPELLVQLALVEPHPWNLLRSLQQRFATSDKQIRDGLQKTLAGLRQGPDGRQDIDEWLVQLSSTTAQLRNINLPDGKDEHPTILEVLHILAQASSHTSTEGTDTIVTAKRARR